MAKKPTVKEMPPLFSTFDIYLVTTRNGKDTKELKGDVQGMTQTHALMNAVKKYGRLRNSTLRQVRYEASPQKAVKSK
jgi:hypothetical protein